MEDRSHNAPHLSKLVFVDHMLKLRHRFPSHSIKVGLLWLEGKHRSSLATSLQILSTHPSQLHHPATLRRCLLSPLHLSFSSRLSRLPSPFPRGAAPLRSSSALVPTMPLDRTRSSTAMPSCRSVHTSATSTPTSTTRLLPLLRLLSSVIRRRLGLMR